MIKKFLKSKLWITTTPIAIGVVGIIGLVALWPRIDLNPTEYVNNNEPNVECMDEALCSGDDEEEKIIITHIPTPEAVRGVYMTACVAATPSFRDRLINLIEETELNSVIVDIKDYTGTISIDIQDKSLAGLNGNGCRIGDVREWINSLHEKEIYVIGRITVFQDPYFSKLRPDLAVKRMSDKSVIWKDWKGISYIDPGAEEMWKYMVRLGNESYNVGFDELNFDYIRFPSDGNMQDIYFPFSEERVIADPDYGKADVIRDFFEYLDEKLNEEVPDAVLSADLFGMTATNYDDLNIGQVLEYAEPYFDYLSPMVYPSHYPRGFNGYMNVNAYPYEIVKFSMDRAVERLIAASSTPSKMRPWLQDFDYPVTYTPEMVRTQIQAVYDAGLNSWMMWDASNKYTREIYYSIDPN